MHFSIVRDGLVLPADLTTALHPGDVLRVETDQPNSVRSAPSQGYKAFSHSAAE